MALPAGDRFAGACPRCLGRFALGGAAPLADGAPPAPGQRLGGIELLEELGRGGMGVVYRGYQAELDRELAVKLIDAPGRGRDEDDDETQLQSDAGPRASGPSRGQLRRRFQREAQILARLDHPRIVRLYDYVDDGQLRYLTMQIVDGLPLGQRLAEAGGAMPLQRALALMIQLCRALAYAHGQGVIHRDIKPGNLLVDDDDQLWVSDFGLARWSDHSDALTASQDVLGTLPYMAPERLGRGVIDQRVDLFAVGAVLYQLVTGRLPFGGESPAEVVSELLSERPLACAAPALASNPELQAVLGMALEKDPRERYGSALQLEADLVNLQRGLPVSARPLTRRRRLLRWLWRRRAMATAAVALLALACVWALISAAAHERSRRQLADANLRAERARGAARAAALRAEQRELELERRRRAALQRRQRALGPYLIARSHLRPIEFARLRGVVERLLREALELDPSFVEGRLELLRVLGYRERADLLPRELQALVQQLPAPDRRKLAPLQGPLLLALGAGVPIPPSFPRRFQAARPELVHPTTWAALHALVLTEVGAHQAALDAVEQLQRDPVARSWEVGYLRARILRELGRYREAAEQLDRLIERHPRHIILLTARANLARLLEDVPTAMQRLAEAHAVDPSSHYIWHVRALLAQKAALARPPTEHEAAAREMILALRLALEAYRREPGPSTGRRVRSAVEHVAGAPAAWQTAIAARVAAAAAGDPTLRRELALIAARTQALNARGGIARAQLHPQLQQLPAALLRAPWREWLRDAQPAAEAMLADGLAAAQARWAAPAK